MRMHLSGFWIAVLGAVPACALAHGGGLDGNGCHNDRKRGEYHCHRAASAARPAGWAPTAPTPISRALGNNVTDSVTPGGGAYRNCTAARAAGAAPVRRGDPGYGAHLDRDGDGVGCE